MQKPIILPPLCAPPGQFPVPLPRFPPPSCSPCSPQPCCPPPCGPCFPPCCPPQSHPPGCPPMCCSPPYAPCGPMAPASPRCPLPPCIPGQTKFSNCGSCGGRSTIVRVPKGCCPPPCHPCCPCLNVSNCCTPCYPRCACCTNCCPPPCCNEPCQPGQQSNPENDKPPCFNNCNFYCTEMPKGKFSLKPAGENEVCQSTDSFDDCIGSGSPAGGIPKGDTPRRPPSRFLNRAAGDDQLAPVPRRSPPRRSDKRESFSSTTESPSYSSSSYEYSRSRKYMGSTPREQEVVARSPEHKEDSGPESFPRRVDGFLKPVICIPRDKCRETGEDSCATWPTAISRDNATGDGKSVSGKSERLSLSTIPSLKTSCLAPPNTYISSTNSARLTAMTLKSLCVDSVTDNRPSFIVGPAAPVKCTQSRQRSHFVTANQSSLKSTCIKTVVRRKGQVETRDASATSHRTVFVETSKTSNQDKVCETVEFSRMQASSVNNSRSSNYGCAPGKHSHGENIRRLSTTFSNSKKPEKLRTKLEWEFQQPFSNTRLNDEHQGPSKTGELSKMSGDIPRRSARYADCRQCTGDGLHSFPSTISNQPSLKKYPVLHRNSFPSNQSQQSGDTRKKLSALWTTNKNGRVIKALGNEQKNAKRKEPGFYPKVKSISKEIVPSRGSGFQTCKNYSGIRREEGTILNHKSAITPSRIAVETLTVKAEESKTYDEDPTEMLLEKKCSTQTTYHQQTCISRYRDGGGDESREHELCVVTCVVQESTKWSPPFEDDGDKVRLPPQVNTNDTYFGSTSLVDDKERVCSNVVIEEIIEPINDNNGAEDKVSECEVTRVGSPSSEQAVSANDCAVEEPAPLAPLAPSPVINICNTDDSSFELRKLDSARGSCVRRSLSFVLPSVINSSNKINGLEQINNKSESEVISVPSLAENSTNLSVSLFRKKRKAKRRLLDETLLCNNDENHWNSKYEVIQHNHIGCFGTIADSNSQIQSMYVNEMANQGPPAYVPNDIQRLVHKRKECEEAKDYHRVSAYELSSLIANCQYHVPEMKNLERVLGEVRYVYGQNFAEFYLMWQQEFERFALLDSWLNFHAVSRESQQFQPMRSEMLKRFSGSIVLAKWVVDGRWYRANLLSYDKDNNWLSTVYYTDRGNVELQELETLKIIPKEVRKIPSMIFRAALSGQLISPAEAWTRGHTNLEFLVRSTHSAVLQCEVLTVDTRAKHFLATVKLSVPYSLNERSQFLSINKAVMDTLKVEEKIGIFRSLTDGPLQAEKPILPHNLSLAFPVPSNDPSYYKITSMKSLRHFYVVEDTDVADQSARNLYREIRSWSLLEQPYNSEKWKIATDRIIDNRIYMYWNSYSQWWERVQVTRTDTPSRSCFAFFVDNGKFGLVNQEDLREAPSFVFQTPARVLRASLAHVTLANPNNNIAAKKSFQTLTLGVRFVGACIGTDSVQDSWAPNGVDVNLMVLVDMSKIRDRRGKIVTLQQELYIQQHVKSTGFVTGPSRLGVLGNPDARLYDRKCLKQVLVNGSRTKPGCVTLATEAFVFDALDDEHLVPDNDIDMETIDLKQYFQGDRKVHPIYEDAGRICSEEPYFSDQQVFGKLSSPPHRTVTYRYKKLVAYRPALKHGTASAFEKTFAQYIGIGGVIVSYSEGPGVIYLQSLQRMSELEKMEKDMITLLQNYGIDIDYEEIEGSLLGGLLCSDGDSVSPKWHRVFVYKAIPEKQIAKVLLVDYGNMANIPYKNLRLLPEYIYSVSFFCQRAHLDAKRGYLRQSRWTTRANRQFKEFLGLCKSITFFPSGSVAPNCEVPLIDYGQDVWFDDNELVWYGGGHTRDYPVMPVTGQSRTIFQHLVKSIGVNLWLESEFSTPGQITFENIEDILQ